MLQSLHHSTRRSKTQNPDLKGFHYASETEPPQTGEDAVPFLASSEHVDVEAFLAKHGANATVLCGGQRTATLYHSVPHGCAAGEGARAPRGLPFSCLRVRQNWMACSEKEHPISFMTFVEMHH